MKPFVLIFCFIFCGACLHAQRKGADTLDGYIVKSPADTIRGKIILAYTIVRIKKEDQKHFKREDWYDWVDFIGPDGKVITYGPSDIAGYGILGSGENKIVFSSFDITIPNKGLLLMKGKGRQFLSLGVKGTMGLYWYYHREDGLGETMWLYDAYLLNDKNEMRVLKLKKMSSKYRLTEMEDWFAGFPDLSKYDLRGLYSFELTDLVRKYNAWKKNGP